MTDDAVLLPAFAPLVLQGKHVRLVPLSLEYLPQLIEAGADPAIWTWYPRVANSPVAMQTFVSDALNAQAQGTGLPFVLMECAHGAVIGSTRYGAIDAQHRRAEIGWTWITPQFQRTAANTEAKFLLLRHAFETLKLNRIEFKTDSLNEKSRLALLRIGATEEGTFRQHIVTHTGRIRHSVYYSIVRPEWLTVKRGLEQKLAAGGA